MSLHKYRKTRLIARYIEEVMRASVLSGEPQPISLLIDTSTCHGRFLMLMAYPDGSVATVEQGRLIS